MTRPDGHAYPRTVGRYVLYGELAAGGMATVHFGRLSGPVGFSRSVAIKRLHPHYAKDPEFVSMFLDEARLCGRIRHPNVVPTLDVVATEGEIFIVMEYVAGEALSKLLKNAWQRSIAMPPRIAATILSSVLHGLHAAHQTKDEHGRELGIVHRDVSPQNILVGSDGTSRVLDFGVAKATGRVQTTRDGQVKGKIAYMPPEQLNGGFVSRQSDIYAASVVLWEALAGRRLFDGETEAVVLVRAIEGKIDPPSAFNPYVDAATDAVVLRGLAREPADRYETARDMALAIEQTLGLASPYEVGEWVESVAAEEIARRARTIAEIESSSMSATSSAPRIAVSPVEPVEPPHSQVSSISVSRAAVSASVPPHRNKQGMRIFGAVSGLLGVVGIVLGGIALTESRSRSAGAPNELVHEARPIALLEPPSAASKAIPEPAASAAEPPKVVARPAFAAAPRRAAPPRPNPCEPPYTVDPATGRKKYKLECLK
jgi:eukaryotic-like serine/threonine-protein kinase